jgi:DNA-binding response OmpR family regulator
VKILLVEDEAPIAAVVKKGLERAGYLVEIASDGEDGLSRALEGGWSAILLDVMLPKRDGIEVCRALRLKKDRTPILMLTARDTVPDRVKGLDTGADDYLPKPFAFEELLARVRALLRREGTHRSSIIRVRDLEIDTNNRSVKQSGSELALTPREYSLLEALARNEGRALTREMILERVWGDDGRIGSNTVDVYINMLRRKLDSDGESKLIHTVHGVGYALRTPISETETETEERDLKP